MLLKPGITETELEAQKSRQRAIAEAEKAVVEAAKVAVETGNRWQLIDAVAALRKLEASEWTDQEQTWTIC